MALVLAHRIGNYIDIAIDGGLCGIIKVNSFSKDLTNASFDYERTNRLGGTMGTHHYDISKTQSAFPFRDLYPEEFSREHTLEIFLSNGQRVDSNRIRFAYRASNEVKIQRRDATKKEIEVQK